MTLVRARFGYMEAPDVPAALRTLHSVNLPRDRTILMGSRVEV